MTDIRSVLINPISPDRPPRRVPLGNGTAQRLDGLGGWQEVPRERREALLEYVGTSVDKLDLVVRLDGFPHTSVAGDVAWLVDLGKPVHQQPPTFKVTGPVPLSGHVFVLASMDFGAEQRRARDGRLVRQELTLHLWKYKSAEVDVLSSPAKKSKAKQGEASKRPRIYIAHRGENLTTIAVKFYGDPLKWHDLAAANGIRDPFSVKAGDRIKVP